MTVLNKFRDPIPKDAVYIGRGSRWGNPFKISTSLSRDAVCELYENKLEHEITIGTVRLSELAALHGKDLVCYCAPRRCHGHSLERAAEWAYQQLNQEKKHA